MTTDAGTKRIKDVIARLGPVRPLAETAARVIRADKALKSYLPSLLADYCTVRLVSRTELTLEAYSQAVATHLRFSETLLLDKLKRLNEFNALQRIVVKVATLPQATLHASPAGKPNPVSEANLAMLRETAKNLSSEMLGDAVERLAVTIERRQNKKPPG